MTADSKWILSESVGSTALDLNRAKLTLIKYGTPSALRLPVPEAAQLYLRKYSEYWSISHINQYRVLGIRIGSIREYSYACIITIRLALGVFEYNQFTRVFEYSQQLFIE